MPSHNFTRTALSFWLLVVLLLATVSSASAQARADRWQFKLEDDTYVWDVRLARLGADTLYVTQADSLVAVPVARITEARRIRKSEMQMGGGGSTAGAMSALTGSDDDVFDFQTLDFAGRLAALQQLLQRFPPGTEAGD